MKVLVTGSTGFIGHYVVTALLEAGHEVLATSSNPNNAARKPWFPGVKYIPLDLADLDTSQNYYAYFHQPDAMIHLAWEGLPRYKDDFHTEINLPRHILLLSNLTKNGLKNLTVAGTCLEYGMQEGCLKENIDTDPVIAYPLAKNELRKALERQQKSLDFNLKWVRLFYMFGEGQNPNSLLSQLDKAVVQGETVFNMSGGEQVRDYLPVEKVADCLVKIAEQESLSGIINCCSNKPVKVKDFVSAYLKQKKSNIQLNLGYYPYNDYEPMEFWGDDTRLKTILKK
ncbi:MAG: NAD-dependent epimerase/dehydratase family protein [Flavisolibacter sp.]|jgi:dTDP-6-deoxy-L-talose 4-dehydrogenase (NAD+)|nr:NAD-dependent epimerase/dehydratase family protein [Flavisolibacter sp.]